MEFIKPYSIVIPTRTELNRGPSEDSDSVGEVQEPITVLVVGPKAEGALPIKFVKNGQPVGETIYFHQPPTQ